MPEIGPNRVGGDGAAEGVPGVRRSPAKVNTCAVNGKYHKRGGVPARATSGQCSGSGHTHTLSHCTADLAWAGPSGWVPRALRRLRAQRAVVVVGEHVVRRCCGALAALRRRELFLRIGPLLLCLDQRRWCTRRACGGGGVLMAVRPAARAALTAASAHEATTATTTASAHEATTATTVVHATRLWRRRRADGREAGRASGSCRSGQPDHRRLGHITARATHRLRRLECPSLIRQTRTSPPWSTHASSHPPERALGQCRPRGTRPEDTDGETEKN